MYSTQEFWFGTEAVPSEKLTAYLKSEKVTEVAHHVTSWASETGKGLLFYGKDSTNATGVIQLVSAILSPARPTAFTDCLSSSLRPASPLLRVTRSSPWPPRATSTSSRLPAPLTATTGSSS